MSPGQRRRGAGSGNTVAADRLLRADRSRTFPPLPRPDGADGPRAASWWGRAWLEALESSALDAARLARGRTYAGDGHVDTINVTPGRVIATVRGSRPRPYTAEVRVRTLDEQEWEALLDGVAARSDRLTALLGKELPRALAEGDVPLLPEPGELVPRCSCPDSGRPCKHAAALCFEVARLLDADPFVLLLLRGRGERELLDELARRNAGHDARESRVRAALLAVAASGSGGSATVAPAATPVSMSASASVPASSAPAPAPASSRSASASASARAWASGDAAATASASASVPGAVPLAAPQPREAVDSDGEAVPAAAAPRGVLAREALADRPRRPLPPPMAVPPRPGQPPALPDAVGLPFDAATLELLAADAAARAHGWLSAAGPDEDAGPAGPGPFAALPPWEDAIRLAATAHPTAGLTATTRALYREVAAATGRTPADIARSVAAWRQGGAEGLALLERTWNPPAGDFDRARSALLAAGLPSLRPHDNHLTHAGRGIQLRFGRDHRWYPYESEPGADDWWPTGPADPDPVGALSTLLAR
ncbi:SWIM zinc finger family protein [Streptomyces sp. BHT-5-2]|uniref:SWIM zinc finger family protein n=1 Tax=Streptomyces sp. BHT-5-2 TaxID=2866715 RepID=UPI001C8E772B|nr:SWIM zinc finger family protein [Streptomyces sp. BHT-5-2]QZL06119.1 SWIM zinc finger family protein [Streptomyces sp. BHT-5-2]